MKTKIIYISGGEVFDMAEIRAAFDEVRAALGLGGDTIMFGVPVDADSALSVAETTTEITNDTISSNEPNDTCVPSQIPEPTPEIQPITDTTPTPVVNQPRKTRTRKVATVDTDSEPDIVAPTTDVIPDEEKVIPILSILAANQDEPVENSVPDADESTVDSDIVAQDEEPVVVDDVDTNIVANATEIISDTVEPDSVTETVSVDESEMTDEAPVVPVEKTLEQLLESMTPLREEVHTASEDAPIMDDMLDFDNTDSADATLAQLASEFAENQDKIVPTPRAENHGKIGKLKNILPFKKIKRDDNGLMGDLFGWAGIAANDDDFSMPGFFTNAASKK